MQGKNIRVNENLWKRLRIEAANQGTTIGKVLEDILLAWVLLKQDEKKGE